jgi:PAS domain S-box-containing protein
MLWACAGIILVALAAPYLALAQNVLLLYDERRELPGLSAFDEAFARTISSEAPNMRLYREEMDLSRLDFADYRLRLRDHLRSKYSGTRFDAVIAVMGPALDFALLHGTALAPGAPIVFAGVDPRELHDRVLPDRVTGVLLARHFAPTVELALRLHPTTRRFVFVAGTSDFDRRLLAQAQEELRPFNERYEFRYLTDLPMPRLLTELQRLPEDTVVLYSTIFRDGAGAAFVPHLAAELVAAASNSPVYGFVDQFVGHGIIGGRMYSLTDHGEEAARRLLSVLDNDGLASFPPPSSSSLKTIIDFRQLERWGVPEEALPNDAAVVYQRPTLWSQYKGQVVAGVSILCLQALMISALLVQRSKGKRAELKLRESESRLQTMADTVPALIWMAGPGGEFIFVNRTWQSYTGVGTEETLDNQWLSRVHSADLIRCFNAFEGSLVDTEEFSVECRLRRHDGTYRWMLCTGVPRLSFDGEYVGHVGCCTDINERKETEFQLHRHRAQLAHMNRVATMGELTASVAHELCQPLGAILSNAGTAEMVLGNSASSSNDAMEILKDIQEDAQRAGETIHRIRSMMRKHDVTRRPVELKSMFEDLHRLVHAEANARRVIVQSEPTSAWVLADRIQLQQVLLNLVLNALDAVSARADGDRRIAIAVRDGDADDSVTITVSDTGHGIPPDVQALLFQPFYTTKVDGLGMGLSITRTIVEAHGGSVWAENNENGGATFCIEMPATTSERVAGLTQAAG